MISTLEIQIFFAGALVSGVGSLVGFGGGFLMVPLLVRVFGLPIVTVVAASLAAIFPSAFYSTLVNLKRGKVDLGLALSIELLAVPAALFGVTLSSTTDPATLKRIFAFALGGIGLKLCYETFLASTPSTPLLSRIRLGPFLDRSDQEEPYKVSLPATTLLGGIAGFLAGLLGIGGGFLKSPTLVRGFGVPPSVAAASSLASVTVTSFFAAGKHYMKGNLDPRLATVLILGFLTGSVIGNAYGKKASDQVRRRLIAITILLAGVTMGLP